MKKRENLDERVLLFIVSFAVVIVCSLLAPYVKYAGLVSLFCFAIMLLCMIPRKILRRFNSPT